MRYKNIHPCKKWYDCKHLLEGRPTKQHHVCETLWSRVWLKRPLDRLTQSKTPSESSARLKKDGTWWRLLKGYRRDTLWDSLGKPCVILRATVTRMEDALFVQSLRSASGASGQRERVSMEVWRRCSWALPAVWCLCSSRTAGTDLGFLPGRPSPGGPC